MRVKQPPQGLSSAAGSGCVRTQAAPQVDVRVCLAHRSARVHARPLQSSRRPTRHQYCPTQASASPTKVSVQCPDPRAQSSGLYKFGVDTSLASWHWVQDSTPYKLGAQYLYPVVQVS